MKNLITPLLLLFAFNLAFSQNKLQTINQIVSEAENNSQLETLAHELMDQIGPGPVSYTHLRAHETR